MVKAGIFFVAALYALGVCWPASAASSSSVSRIQTTHVTNGFYTASASFQTSAFSSMDYVPKSFEGEPRPHITRVSGGAFPDSLNNPTKLPSAAPSSEGVLPKPTASYGDLAKVPSFKDHAIKNLTSIIKDNSTEPCKRCHKALRLGQRLIWAKPEAGPEIMIELCKQNKFSSKPTVDVACEGTFGQPQLGSVYTQLLSYANLTENSTTLDYMCKNFFPDTCNYPEMKKLSDDFLHSWFKGQVEPPSEVASRSQKVGPKSDKPLRVFHGSDFHLDARYAVDAEANCDNGQCCRADSYNSTLWSKPLFEPGSLPRKNISRPAEYWGYYQCDSPWSLIGAAMEGVEAIQKDGGLDWAIYTGDLTTHDETWHYSQDLVKYSEQSLYDMFHRHLGNTTMVVALGNHDSSMSDVATPSNLPDNKDQLSWDWDNVAALVKSEGWGDNKTAETIRSHYGGYSVSPRKGLRIIALNSDFWYHGNPMTFLNLDDPDVSGMLRWFTDELEAAEKANERVWAVAHVLSGWNGGDGVDGPTNLLYMIVNRFRHTIAHFFFGHTHEDEFQLWYKTHNGNSSDISRKTEDVTAHAFIGPSVTPLHNVNPSLRVYEVDPETYSVMDYTQYYTPIDDFKTGHPIVWYELYRARKTYEDLSASKKAGTYKAPVQLDGGKWPQDAPLNASFWAALTDEMEQRPELIELHHMYQGRNSPRSPACNTDKCHKAKLCYMRSASSNLGRNCPSGFGSVQSG